MLPVWKVSFKNDPPAWSAYAVRATSAESALCIAAKISGKPKSMFEVRENLQ